MSLDGLTDDWSAGDQLASNGMVLFGKEDGGDLCFRVDVGLLFNSAPVAEPDAFTTDEDTVLSGENVLADNGSGADSDPDSDPLTVTGHDALSIQGAAVTVAGNGDITYDPTSAAALQALADGESVDDTLTYTIEDPSGGSDSATVTVTVDGANDAPTAMDDRYETDEDVTLVIPAPGVLTNDDDVDTGATLTAVLDTDVSNGTLTLNPDGSLSYTPALNFNGSDTFTYRASDGTVTSNLATVTITVNPVNDPPVADAEIVSAACNIEQVVEASAGETAEATAPVFRTVTDNVLIGDSDPVEGTAIQIIQASGAPGGTSDGTAPFEITTTSGTVNAADGPAVDADQATAGLVFDSVTSAGSSTEGISLANVAGSQNTSIGGSGVFFDSTGSTGGATGIVLTNAGAGAFTANGGSITGRTGRGVDVAGGTGDVTVAALIGTTTTGRSVEVTGHTGVTSTNGGGPDNNPNGGGVAVIGSAGSTTTFDINANNLSGVQGAVIQVIGLPGSGQAVTLNGTIGGATLADANTLSTDLADGIDLDFDGDGSLGSAIAGNIVVRNNTIDFDDDGIGVDHRDAGGTMNVTIRDNTLNAITGDDAVFDADDGIFIFIDDDVGTNVNQLNLEIIDNTVNSLPVGKHVIVVEDVQNGNDVCFAATGNSNGGGNGDIELDTDNAADLVVDATSSADLSTLNNGIAVNEVMPVTYNSAVDCIP